MSDQTKILTVSYGTFSCTLEGFDDPFGTMRGIAEYFRDLAAEDRYFGAEPPTPDVEMLQNIAQRDVQRRVEARIGESGVSLRAAEPVEDAELAEVAAPAPAPAPPPAPPVAEAAPEVPEVPETAPLTFDDEYLMADEPEDAFTIDTAATPSAEPAPESIAEKLRRIRAVVSRNIEPKKDAPGPFDPSSWDDDAPAPRRDRALSETIRSITADISEDDDVDALTPASGAEAETVGNEGSIFAEDIGDDDAEDAALPEAAPDLSETISEVIAETGAETSDDEVADEDDEDEAWNAADAASLDEDDADAFEDEDEDDFEDEDWAEDAVEEMADDARDEVRATAEDEDEDDVEDFEDDVDDPDTVEAVVRGAPETDVEAEADFEAESDVEAEAADEARAEDAPDEGADEAVPDAEDAGSRVKSAQLEPLSETNGAVGRLLKATDEKFADGDGIRRRRVISQMRAAVAATKAERMLGKPVNPDQQRNEELSPYRRDLDRIMPAAEAPETPEAAAPAPPPAPEPTPEPAAAAEPQPRPAPLVLVSSQRVDDAPMAPVKPSMPQKRVVSEAGGFAAFAQEMGAEELPDLLEAAAAFSAFVEGQPHFSRPEIMKRVAKIDPALSLSREAGLRSFGMLLRQGKIRKLQRGQFAIAEDTRFNPAHRIAGQ